jgi:hypothetical protein
MTHVRLEAWLAEARFDLLVLKAWRVVAERPSGQMTRLYWLANRGQGFFYRFTSPLPSKEGWF